MLVPDRLHSRTAKWLTPTLAAAVALGAGAVATAAGTQAIRRRHPPDGAFADIDGVRLHVRETGGDAGDGAPVLLIHGNAVTAQDWFHSGVAQRFSARHRVIAPDRPGFGHSDRPRDRVWSAGAQAAILAGLLQARGARPAIVIGHSFGAQVALRLALDYAHLVSRVILASGYYFPSFRIDSALVAPLAIPVLGDIWRRSLAQPLGRVLTKPTVHQMFAPRRPPEGFAAGPFEPSLTPLAMRAAAADGAYMVLEAAALQKRLAEITTPTVLIVGDSDKIVDPNQQSGRFAETVRIARLIRVLRAGHMTHYADPEAFLQAAA